ncbi:hypothetical protein ABZ883_16265 [Streptomyces sp. NPDC046977]|uniref:hypothetical protein n=1 Tax=Streptomyces sp. NPDC046977 TaxID=3154703 RepID=UPI0033D3FDC7
MPPQPARGVLAVVGSAAGGVESLRDGLVLPALARGRRVAVTLTPTAARQLRPLGEIDRLERATGLLMPAEPRLRPAARGPLSRRGRRPGCQGPAGAVRW